MSRLPARPVSSPTDLGPRPQGSVLAGDWPARARPGPGQPAELVVAVCGAAPRAAYAGSRPLDFEVLFLGTASLPAGDYVLRDVESWIAFCDASNTVLCQFVDFRHETVIASVAGPQPSSCYGISIDAIERLPGRAVEVSVADTEPISDRCVCVQGVTQPAVAVAVSGPISTVEFVHESVQRGCGPCTHCGFAIPEEH